MHERIRDALLGRWGRGVTTHPLITVIVCLLLACAAVILTVQRIEFRPDRSELVDPDLPWNRRYADYKEKFPRWNDLIICLLGGLPDDRRVDDLARRIAAALAEDDEVIAAEAGFDPVTEAGARLFATAPAAEFQASLERLRSARHLVAAGNANAALSLALRALEQQAQSAGSVQELQHLLDPYLDALEGAPDIDFRFMTPGEEHRWQPLASGNGLLRYIRVHLAPTTSGVDATSAMLARIRQRVSNLLEGQSDPPIAWGVTGIAAIEADETAQSINDSTLASVAAALLITVLMITVFRGLVVPLLATGSLLIGLAWSFGWLVLSVGHLQLLSVVFSVILLGLGVDFALHIVARLELVQDEHADLPSAVSRVFRGIGPGMLTGAVTTAAAFGATALTDFLGMAEMGIIAAGGVLLCLIAMLCVFPAALALTGNWKHIIRHRQGGETAHFAWGRLDTVDSHPAWTLAVAAVVVVLAVLPATRVRYDPNVLNLHPPGIESVVWENRIVTYDEGNVWSALIRTTAAEAPELVERLRALPEVSGVGGMGLLLPPNAQERAARIASLRDEPIPASSVEAGPETLRRLLGGVQVGLLTRIRSTRGETRAALEGITQRIAGALAASSARPEEDQAQQWQRLEDAFLTARGSLAAWVSEALRDQPPEPSDLPAALQSLWLGSDDSWLLTVSPADDPAGRPVLDPQRLGPFVESVRSVTEDVFGPPVQIYESSRIIVRAYGWAAGYALAAILALLVLDFRSLADAFCSLAPVSIGFIGVFAMMGLVGEPLNFANIIVMPLIFGIGVDAGVHMVHRWRAEPYGRPAGLSGGTGRGITLTMLTTMIGFGCMLLAQHRGFRSLGFVMVVGLGITLLACYGVLPAILRLRRATTAALRVRPAQPGQADPLPASGKSRGSAA